MCWAGEELESVELSLPIFLRKATGKTLRSKISLAERPGKAGGRLCDS